MQWYLLETPWRSKLTAASAHKRQCPKGWGCRGSLLKSVWGSSFLLHLLCVPGHSHCHISNIGFLRTNPKLSVWYINSRSWHGPEIQAGISELHPSKTSPTILGRTGMPLYFMSFQRAAANRSQVSPVWYSATIPEKEGFLTQPSP